MHTGINDKGIIQSYASASLYYPQNSGFILDFQTQKDMAADVDENEDLSEYQEQNPDEISDLYVKNQNVYKGLLCELVGEPDTINSQPYSLYELYGDDIHWYRYMGERTYYPSLLDHIWCAVDQKKTDELLEDVFETIDYEAPVYLSCQVYRDRPKVLSETEIDNGYRDPRVKLSNVSYFNGYGYVLGSLEMGFAKFVNSTIALLLSDKIISLMTDKITEVETSDTFKEVFIPLIWIVVGFAMIGLILSLVKAGIRYSKGQGSSKEAIERFLIGMVCLGLILVSANAPDRTNQTIYKVVTIVDGFFNASLTKSSIIQNDEVIAVTDKDYIVGAVLWKNGIFNPWCRGQFDDRNYEELYTNYADLTVYGDTVYKCNDCNATFKDTYKMDKHLSTRQHSGFTYGGENTSRMTQSFDVADPNDATNTPVYNSTATIGDVYVYVGNNKYIRNWAAYLYSCGSKYHIDTTLDTDAALLLVGKDTPNKTDRIKEMVIKFPNANTCAYNSSLMADTFRVVDAQMDISPQYFPDGSKASNYINAHKLKTHFAGQGFIMMFNSLLLVFFIPIIISKFKNFILLIILPLQCIWFSLLELFKPADKLKELGDSFKNAFFGYFTACIKQNIMILFYLIFVDKGIFMTVMYILLCITLLGFTYQDAKRFVNNTIHNIERVKNSI